MRSVIKYSNDNVGHHDVRILSFVTLRYFASRKVMVCDSSYVMYSMCTQGGAPKRFFHLL